MYIDLCRYGPYGTPSRDIWPSNRPSVGVAEHMYGLYMVAQSP